MSHFTVLVVGEDIEAQLAPFQENNMGDCPSKYMKFFDKETEMEEEWEANEKTVSEWYAKVRFTAKELDNDILTELVEKGEVKFKDINSFDLTLNTLDPNSKCSARYNEELIYFKAVDIQVANAEKKPAQRSYSFTAVKIDEPRQIPIQEYYTDFEEYIKDYHGFDKRDIKTGKYGYWENPNAKWDWYQVGGRWTGFFTLKKGCKGDLGEKSWCNADAQVASDAADQARKGDIDWDKMLTDNFEEYSKKYDDFEKLLKEDPDKAKDTAYWDFGIENISGKTFDEEWIPEPRELYLNRAVPSTFAVIRDGKWYEKGSMGWWGVVADKKEVDKWAKEFKKLVDDLPDETLLTVVDCHI